MEDSVSAVKFPDWRGGGGESSVEYLVVNASPRDDWSLKNSTAKMDSSDKTSDLNVLAIQIYNSGKTFSRTYVRPEPCFGCSVLTRLQTAR